MAEIKKISKQGALKLLEIKSTDPEYIVTLGDINRFFDDYDVTDNNERIDIINKLSKAYKN